MKGFKKAIIENIGLGTCVTDVRARLDLISRVSSASQVFSIFRIFLFVSAVLLCRSAPLNFFGFYLTGVPSACPL